MVKIVTTIQRKDNRLPRFAVFPASAIAVWNRTATFTVEGTLNGVDLGRRGCKPWDANWFIELPEPLCKRAKVDTGSSITLALSVADASLPAELAELLARDADTQATWDQLTPAQQRMHCEYVRAAKSEEARTRRASKIFH